MLELQLFYVPMIHERQVLTTRNEQRKIVSNGGVILGILFSPIYILSINLHYTIETRLRRSHLVF